MHACLNTALQGAEPLAYTVIGLVQNGKASLTSLLTTTIGGYAGIYAQLSNSTDAAARAAAHWTTLSTSLNVIAEGHQKGQHTSALASAYVVNFT
jgi:hypothetical protein